MDIRQYPNPNKFPPLEALSGMFPRDIGHMLLPVIARTNRAFVPYELIRGLTDQSYPRDMGAEDLLFEGLAYLEQIGYVVEAMTMSQPIRMIRISRAGRAAAKQPSIAVGAHAARTQPLVELLHHLVINEALPEVDRGPDYFGGAITDAFRAVEIAVRSAAMFDNDKYGVDLMNAAFGPTGPLRDREAERSEEDGIRETFVGAIKAFKNPGSHRNVEERDPRQAMRLLVFASLLIEIAEKRRPF